MQDTPARLEVLHALHRRQALSDAALRRATEHVTETPSNDAWLDFVAGSALGIGVLSLMGAFGTLVVENWMQLGAHGQIALAMLVFAAPGYLAIALGVERLVGKLAVSAAAGLIGPLFMVIEANYSAEGNWWLLFAAWALLTLPLAVAARFAPLVIGVLVIADCTWLAFYNELDALFRDWPAMGAAFGITTVHLVALAVWEWVHGTRPWLQGRWGPRTVGATAVGALVVAAVPAMWGTADWAGIGALALLVVLTPVLQVLYWRRGKDLLLAAAPLMAGLFLFANLAGRFFIDTLDSELGILLGVPVVGVMVVVLTVVSLAWLRLGLRQADDE